MPHRKTKGKDVLHMTRQEAESLGVEWPVAWAELPEDLRERPLHEQVAGQLTEDDVAEALTGEDTEETREEVEEAVSDNQEAAAEQP